MLGKQFQMFQQYPIPKPIERTVKRDIGIISPESLRTEHKYSALLSSGAEEHNSDGKDDLTNL